MISQVIWCIVGEYKVQNFLIAVPILQNIMRISLSSRDIRHVDSTGDRAERVHITDASGRIDFISKIMNLSTAETNKIGYKKILNAFW